MKLFSLTSPVLEVTKILKPTKAKLFKDLSVGSKIKISLPLESPGVGRSSYAAYLKIKILGSPDYVHKSLNELGGILPLFEFKEVIENKFFWGINGRY